MTEAKLARLLREYRCTVIWQHELREMIENGYDRTDDLKEVNEEIEELEKQFYKLIEQDSFIPLYIFGNPRGRK